MARIEDIRDACQAPGCVSQSNHWPKWAKVAVYDAAGVLKGRFCKACGQRAYVRELRREGVRPFEDFDDRTPTSRV